MVSNSSESEQVLHQAGVPVTEDAITEVYRAHFEAQSQEGAAGPLCRAQPELGPVTTTSAHFLLPVGLRSRAWVSADAATDLSRAVEVGFRRTLLAWLATRELVRSFFEAITVPFYGDTLFKEREPRI